MHATKVELLKLLGTQFKVTEEDDLYHITCGTFFCSTEESPVFNVTDDEVILLHKDVDYATVYQADDGRSLLHDLKQLRVDQLVLWWDGFELNGRLPGSQVRHVGREIDEVVRSFYDYGGYKEPYIFGTFGTPIEWSAEQAIGDVKLTAYRMADDPASCEVTVTLGDRRVTFLWPYPATVNEAMIRDFLTPAFISMIPGFNKLPRKSTSLLLSTLKVGEP